MGFVASLIQLGVAAIPAGLYEEWEILLITACGTALAYSIGTPHEWSQGPSAARRDNKSEFALMGGFADRDVIVVKNKQMSHRLDDLARVEGLRGNSTIVATCLQLILWTALLITVAGVKSNT